MARRIANHLQAKLGRVGENQDRAPGAQVTVQRGQLALEKVGLRARDHDDGRVGRSVGRFEQGERPQVVPLATQELRAASELIVVSDPCGPLAMVVHQVDDRPTRVGPRSD